VIALAGIGRPFHFAKKRVHFLGLQAAAGAHSTVASHRGCYLHQAAFERQRLVPFADVLGEIADQAGAIDFAEQRRGLAQSNSARAKSLDDQAIALELIGACDKPLDIALIDFDDFRNEKDLSGHAILGDRLF